MNVDRRVPKSVKSQTKSCRGKRKSDDALKVVYISSPMKVKTSASRFRSLVQQLTGKNSDISEYVGDDNNSVQIRDFYAFDCHDQSITKETRDPYRTSQDETSTSSDSLPGAMDDVFTSQMTEQFEGIFSSNSFCDPSGLDVLGSFDEFL